MRLMASTVSSEEIPVAVADLGTSWRSHPSLRAPRSLGLLGHSLKKEGQRLGQFFRRTVL